MKFIIIAEEFPPSSGGVATHSLRIAKILFRLGKLEAVISLNRAPLPNTHYPFPFYHVDMPSRKYGARRGDSFVGFRKINSLLFNIRKRYVLKYNNPLYKTLEQLAKPADCIFLYTYAFYFRELILPTHKRFHIPFWVLYHGLDLIEINKTVNNLPAINQAADKIVFNSYATKALFKKLAYSTKQEAVLFPGLDLEALKANSLIKAKDLSAKFSIKSNHVFTIITLCRLIKRKGIDIAIEALAPLLKSKKDIQFLIMGNGPEKENLMVLAKKLDLLNKVKFLGFVSEQEKYSLLNQADIFVMPNRKLEDNFEGFGIVYLEAMYYKNIIIGGKADGVTEAIRASKGRLTFDFNKAISKKQLLDTVRYFYQHQGEMEKLKQDNYKHVCKTFDLEKLFSELLGKAKYLAPSTTT